MPKTPHVPAYKLHKTTGQARVIIRGRHHYLGPYGSPESREKYGRLIAELAVGKEPPPAGSPTTSPTSVLVVELVARYWEFAQSYYVKDGRRSRFLHTIRLGLRALRSLYGSTPVDSFGPLAFQAIQRQFVAKGLCRGYTNQLCAAIRRMFKWGVSQELVPPSVYQALATVPGLVPFR